MALQQFATVQLIKRSDLLYVDVHFYTRHHFSFRSHFPQVLIIEISKRYTGNKKTRNPLAELMGNRGDLNTLHTPFALQLISFALRNKLPTFATSHRNGNGAYDISAKAGLNKNYFSAARMGQTNWKMAFVLQALRVRDLIWICACMLHNIKKEQLARYQTQKLGSKLLSYMVYFFYNKNDNISMQLRRGCSIIHDNTAICISEHDHS